MSEKTKLLYKIEAFDSDYDRDRPDKCTVNIGGEQGKAYFYYDYKKHRYLAAFISDDFDVYDNIATKEKEIERLHSIIKEVREYITNHREAVDERGEHILYFLKDDFDEEDILKILDKDSDKE